MLAAEARLHEVLIGEVIAGFRIVQREVVLEDIRRQVAAGAQHITFGNPDFFNASTGSVTPCRSLEALQREYPGLSYEVTMKVEHLLKHSSRLPELRETGCAFVTTALESRWMTTGCASWTRATRALTYPPCLTDARFSSCRPSCLSLFGLRWRATTTCLP
jgi:hypothetical protein